jgi:hypothetical protein
VCTACQWAPHFAAYGADPGSARRVAATAPAGAASPNRPGPVQADFVFHNGPVYTVAGPAQWATALAVTGNVISYVGDDAGVRADC